MSEATPPDIPPMRNVIAALVTNEPGVLAQVAGMFAARGFNIDSLVVGRTENPELSRMTIVVNGDAAVLEQVRKQLQKLVPVVKVVDYSSIDFVERDLMLVQITTSGKAPGSRHHRNELIELAGVFRARVVDISEEQMMIELSGAEGKLEAFVELARPYGIIELARTGVIAMPRGKTSRRPALGRGGRATDPSGQGAGGRRGSQIDEGDLPPG